MSMTFIGSKLFVSVGATPETQAGYTAITDALEVGRVMSIGEIVDTSSDQPFTLLGNGRVIHLNGELDMGEVPVMCDYLATDPGYLAIKPINNTATLATFYIEDADGERTFFQGAVANMGSPERVANAQKTISFVIRPATGYMVLAGI